MWRGGCRLNISVAASFVWRCLSGSAVTPFPHPAHRTGHADFPHPACMGLPLSTAYSILFDLLFLFILFDRAASILPSRPHISTAVARSGGQGRRFFRAAGRFVVDGREHGGRLAGDRVVGGAMIRGEPAIGRNQSREPRLYSVEPVWDPDHEAVIRFCGQGSEAAGPFSQRHCSHSRMRIAATSDRHRLPGASSAVRCRTVFVLSRSRVLLTPPAAARHRPAPRRS